MESTRSRSASLGWKLAFFGPLAIAVVLQVISAKQADLHTGVRLSIIGKRILIPLLDRASYVPNEKVNGLGNRDADLRQRSARFRPACFTARTLAARTINSRKTGQVCGVVYPNPASD